MINEQNNFSGQEGAEVSALLSSLKRVEAPGDFNFRVKARIAQGRPSKARSSWATVALRLSLPAVVMATAGGYLGYKTLSSDNISVVAVNDVQKAGPVTSIPVQPFVEPQAAVQPTIDSAPAMTPETLAAATEQPSRTPKVAQKAAVSTPKPETERAGGSYEITQKAAKTLSQPDEDDNDPNPTPARKVLVSASQFLSNSGVVASSAGSGGRIQAVNGAAAQAGLKEGDIIESVSVVTGTIRVTRDGKSLTVVIK